MGGHSSKNPCRECIAREPVTKLRGSFWRGKRYFFVLAGRQFRCTPSDCFGSKRKLPEAME